ncbi:MAG: EAL domain-containing protein [Lachnospiraceae bacterium]|nr:EAL domain-containing protein [Lachnospiraceae bacterium]
MEQEKTELQDYVLENIDNAVENGWIKVYYQPVIRTISRELCGLEALARWDDPRHGLLSPAVFIPVLEKQGLIPKLDVYMLQQICRDFHEIFKKQKFLVPISMNLSRADFENTDIFGHIIHTVGKYAVPRDMLHIEITESMLGRDSEYMLSQIEHFHEEGFQVWMDDFGSEYSSLNSLKDYNFDELKIDMKFLSNFSVRSQKIIASVVNMAKQIGIKTLAEGVETEEQFEFLRSIGCEKVQGFYFGKPMPVDSLFSHVKEKGIALEPLSRRKYYTQIGKVNFLSPTPFDEFSDKGTTKDYMENQIPLAVMEYANDNLKVLFHNDAYEKELNSFSIEDVSSLESVFKEKKGSLYEKFRAMLRQAVDSKDYVKTDFVRDGSFGVARVIKLGSYPEGMAFLCTVRNLSKGSDLHREGMRLDDSLRALYSVYHRIDRVDLDTWHAKNIYYNSVLRWTLTESELPQTVADFAATEVYPEDRNRYKRFMDLTTLKERITDAPSGYISDFFRTKITTGGYAWSEFILILENRSESNTMLSCVRGMSHDTLEHMIDEVSMTGGPSGKHLSPEILWKNFTTETNIALFWKDKDRRFAGVNQTFLDYYGMESEAELIGKTDEDMGWHVNPEPYKQDEIRVLDKGERTRNIPGKCIKAGIPREIAASKLPIFDNEGNILGLMGYFIDMTELREIRAEAERLSFTDDLTGLLNIRGLMESVSRYIESYFMRRISFAMICVDIMNFRSINDSYGMALGDQVLKATAHSINDVVAVSGVVARVGSDHFIILYQYNHEEDVDVLVERIKRGIAHIHYVDENEVTIYPSVGYSFFDECEDIEQLRLLAEERLK